MEIVVLRQVECRTAIDRVTYKVCGGIGGVSRLTGRSRQKVREWLRSGYVDNRKDALILARAALEKGEPVTAVDLLALDEADVETHPIGEIGTKTGSGRRARARGQQPPSLSRSAVAPAASAFSHASAPGSRRRVILGGTTAANG